MSPDPSHFPLERANWPPKKTIAIITAINLAMSAPGIAVVVSKNAGMERAMKLYKKRFGIAFFCISLKKIASIFKMIRSKKVNVIQKINPSLKLNNSVKLWKKLNWLFVAIIMKLVMKSSPVANSRVG